MTLLEIKNAFAVRNGYKDWADFWAYLINNKATIGQVETFMNEVAEDYCRINK